VTNTGGVTITDFRAETFLVCIKEDKQNISHGFDDRGGGGWPMSQDTRMECPTLIMGKQLLTGQ
jgi:hypothetical protein